jgi:hypothetical protein
LRWREARDAYLSARAALVGQIERQGWRAPARAPATSHVDIVFTGPPGPESPGFVEVEDDQGRSIRYGEWLQRDDGVGAAGACRLIQWPRAGHRDPRRGAPAHQVAVRIT